MKPGDPRQLRLPLPMTPVSDPADFAEYEAQWGRVRDALRSEFGDAAFYSWLKPLSLAAVTEGRVTIAVPTRFMVGLLLLKHIQLSYLSDNLLLEVLNLLSQSILC